MITSSEFYGQLNKYEAARQKAITNLRFKGVDINEAAILDEVANNILSIQQNYELNGDAVILTAELANITITLKDDTDTVVESKNTGVDGGVITFIVPNTEMTYTLIATDSNEEELWTNTITVNGTGTYNCKVGKTLADYTWEEVKEAGVKNLAKYMWNVGDEKKIESFMGSTTAARTTFIIAGFNHDIKVEGGFGITFLMKSQTSSAYQYFSDSNTNSNGVSWVGSLIRRNCLREGEDYYVFDRTVTSSTSGTFYVWDNTNKVFAEKTLPADFAENTKYYTKESMDVNGAFWNGLSSDITPHIAQVKKKTWGGYGGAVTNSTTANADSTIIETSDWLFTVSDSEVFGDSERINNYSKYALEGAQYDYFKAYQEGRLNRSDNSWTRSPYVSNSGSACYWNSSGYVISNITSDSLRLVLGFCL